MSEPSASALDSIIAKIESDHERAQNYARSPWHAASVQWNDFMATWTLLDTDTTRALINEFGSDDPTHLREVVTAAIPPSLHSLLPCGIEGIDVRPKPIYYPTKGRGELEVAYNQLCE